MHEEVARGDTLLLNDGRIVLWVDEVAGSEVRCKVVVGGPLSNNKGINKQGGGLSAPALTAKDREDILFAARIEADYLAVSFVRSAEDVTLARTLLREAGGQGGLVSKIERAEALDCIEEIVDASDVIMVARGDLGVEIGDAELPAAQKRLIKAARQMNCVVITATQMMESMIENPIPTRAEVSDVSNAVIDGSDAVMLSGETAVGKHPVRAIQAMADVCVGAERYPQPPGRTAHRIGDYFERVDEAIAMAVMYTANHLNVKAIIALTESGSTTRWMSRIRSDIPIYAFTAHEETSRRVALYRGVYPVTFELNHTDSSRLYPDIFRTLLAHDLVAVDDLVIFTKGDLTGVTGSTNAMKILKVAA